MEMVDASVCILKSQENLHDPIVLLHGKEFLLGRGPLTRISDTRCSRSQVSLLADIKLKEVKVKQLGSNSTAVNGLALKKNETYTLKHGDKLEMLLGQHTYTVEFRSVDAGIDSPQKGTKRNAEQLYQPAKRLCETSSIDQGNYPEEIRSAGVNVKTTSEDNWEYIDNNKLIIFTSKGVKCSSKIAAYDIDGTIIVTKSGRVFPKDNDDWKISFTEVPGKLKQLWNAGFKIVFFTNQAGISKGIVKIEDFKSKISKIVSKLAIPIQVCISTGRGIYRKPAIGMWNELIKKKNDGVAVDMEESFYCGDAAGRAVNWAPKKKKDFSCSDRLFALNLGLKFHTPEEYFLGYRAAQYELPEFNPSVIRQYKSLLEPEGTNLCLDEMEVIILVGSPGSGKSYFAKSHLVPRGYVHVNRDTLGSWQKCVSSMEVALKKGKSVIVDNTNPDKESRRRFITAAKKCGAACRCFVLTTSPENARHNNKFRELTDASHVPISEAIINMYRMKYEEPAMEEGFSAVVKINFVPIFTNPDKQKFYKMYLLEK